jgi:NADH-quinone oxidoreductase subunit F
MTTTPPGDGDAAAPPKKEVRETRIVSKRLRDFPDDSHTIDRYIATGGYDIARGIVTGGDPSVVHPQLKASGLRGRGGANFPTAIKLESLQPDVWPRYLVINADEGEPSTFKDRLLIEHDPHQLIEGIIIEAYAISATLAFVYLRGEFALGYDRVMEAIADARAKGFLGTGIFGTSTDLEIVVHRGAGAYICGEESGLLESLEGKRGMPRIKPPLPIHVGLYSKPTVINNVETVSTIPHIMQMGGDEYAKLGVNRSTGTRLAAISGHVKRPGVYELEFGMTLRDVIYGIAGGIRDDRELKFFLPGGASFQWLVNRDEHLDQVYDIDDISQKLGTTLGSGAIMVYDETTDPLLVAWRLAKFYAHESCGKCTPCREGTDWLEKVLYRMSHGQGRPGDMDLLLDASRGISPDVMRAPFTQTTICPLGPSPVSAVASLQKYFRAEVDAACGAKAGATA